MNNPVAQEALNPAGRVLLVCLCALAAVVLMPPSGPDVLYYVQAREHASRMIAGCAALAMCWAWMTGRLRVRPGPGHWLMAGLVLLALAGVWWSRDRAAALDAAHGMACWLVAAAAASVLFRNRVGARALPLWLAPVAMVVSVIGLLEWRGLAAGIMPDVDSSVQIASTLGYPSYYAGWLLGMVFVMQAGWVQCRGRGARWLCGAAALLLIGNLVLCRSWAALGVFAAAQAGWLLFIFMKQSRAVRRAVPAALLLLLLAGASLPWVLVSRAPRAAWGAKADSMGLRVMKWRVALAMSTDHPLRGVGPGQYPVYYPLYRARLGLRRAAWETRPDIYYPVVADNDMLLRLVEQGAPGALVFALAMGWTVWFGFSAGHHARAGPRSGARAAAAAGVFAVAGYGMFHFPFEAAGVWGPAWICVGAVWAAARQDVAPPEPSAAAATAQPTAPLAAAQVLLFMACLYMACLPAARWFGDVSMRRGARAAAAGDTAAAAAHFAAAPPGAPRSWRHFYYHGEALLLVGNRRAAAASLQRAASMRPYNLAVLRRLRIALRDGPPGRVRGVEQRIRMLRAPPVVPGEPVEK